MIKKRLALKQQNFARKNVKLRIHFQTTILPTKTPVTALNNLKTTISERPYVPPVDHNTYNPSIFDKSNFLEEIRRRNSNAENPCYIMKNSDLVPYKFTIEEAENASFGRITMEESAIKLRHYNQVRNIIAIDGSHYHLEHQGNDKMKQFSTNFPVLPKNSSPYQRHLWYTQTVIHCHNYGIYLHPWCALRPNVNNRGFNCDNAENGDIPSIFHTYLNRWDTQIAEGIVFKHPHITIPNKDGYI